jgi:hypothetical protein
MKKHLLLLLFFLPVSGTAHAQIVKWTDEHGQIHYGDKVPESYRKDSETVQMDTSNVIENTNNAPYAKPLSDSRRSFQTSDSTPVDPNTLTDDATCQEIYGMSCDRVNNWQKYAEIACKERKHEKNCEDPGYLETKYKPRTLEKIHRSAATGARKRKKQEKMRELKCTGQRRLRDCPNFPKN